MAISKANHRSEKGKTGLIRDRDWGAGGGGGQRERDVPDRKSFPLVECSGNDMRTKHNEEIA